MQVTLKSLFAAPDLYFFAFEGDQASFLPMDRSAYRRSIFLDGRISPAGRQMLKLPLPLLQEHAARCAPLRTGWIFHVAQCGSTLLARALDRPGANLVLREPAALRQLGGERAAGAFPSREARLRLAMAMTSRRYRTDLPTIVKANVPVNFMLDELTAVDAEAPAIFLYFPLETYLAAILRTPQHREWVRRLTGELAPLLTPESGAIDDLGDAERAAALWLAQMRAFAGAMERMPNSRSLDAETLFNDPRAVLKAGSALFEAEMPDTELETVLASDLFATYSKNPAIAFDNEARVIRQTETISSLRPEIDAARRWLETRAAARPLPERLPAPLVGAAPHLL